MTLKQRQPVYHGGPVTFADEVVAVPGTGFAGGSVTPSAGVTLTESTTCAVRKETFAVTDLEIAVTAANDYGGVKLLDLPDSNLLLLSVEVDLELVKGLTTNGIVGTTDVTIGIGTATASNATLSGAMVDVLSGTALTATDESPAYQAHSQADGTLSYPLTLADSATLALYLNVAASITADDTITASGTITIRWIDLGNVTS